MMFLENNMSQPILYIYMTLVTSKLDQGHKNLIIY